MLPFSSPTAFLSVLFPGEVLALRAYLVQKSLPIDDKNSAFLFESSRMS